MIFFSDDEDDVAAYPIVKESAAKLIETGLNTMQKTLLLKKEVEVDRVSDELSLKRAEFRSRMDKCAQQQVEIQKKQQRVGDVSRYIILILKSAKLSLQIHNTYSEDLLSRGSLSRGFG